MKVRLIDAIRWFLLIIIMSLLFHKNEIALYGAVLLLLLSNEANLMLRQLRLQMEKERNDLVIAMSNTLQEHIDNHDK